MRRAFLFFTLLGLAALLGRAARLDRPWTFFDGQCQAAMSIIGRNFERAGILRFPPLQDARTGDPPPGAETSPFAIHPPFVPLTLAAAFRLAGGASEAAARASAILASLLCVAVLYLLARRLRGGRFAAAAVLVMVVAPASSFYGAWVNSFGWWSLLTGLSLFLAFLPWLDPRLPGPGAARGVALGILFLWAMCVEWVAILWIPVALIEALLGGRLRRLPVLVPLLLAVPSALLFYQQALPWPSGHASALLRLATFDQWTPDYWRQILRHHVDLFGWPVLLAAATGFLLLCRRAILRRVTPLDRLTGALILYQAYYTVLYPGSNRIHDFCALHALPALALLAAEPLLGVCDRARRWAGPRYGAILAAALLLPWGWQSVRHALDRWAAQDGEVAAVQALAEIFREAVRRDEVAATNLACVPESVRFYADRAILGAVTTAEALRRARQGPWSPRAFVILEGQVPLHPDLVALLDATSPHGRSGAGRIYDLRNASFDPPAEDGKPPAPTVRAPEALRATVKAGEVEITWTLVPDRRVIGYRVMVGAEPGVYPVQFDVKRPPFRRPADFSGELHFAVAALLDDRGMGSLSEDAVFPVEGRPRYLPTILALLAGSAVLAALHALLVLRRAPPGSHAARRPLDVAAP